MPIEYESRPVSMIERAAMALAKREDMNHTWDQLSDWAKGVLVKDAHAVLDAIWFSQMVQDLARYETLYGKLPPIDEPGAL